MNSPSSDSSESSAPLLHLRDARVCTGPCECCTLGRFLSGPSVIAAHQKGLTRLPLPLIKDFKDDLLLQKGASRYTARIHDVDESVQSVDERFGKGCTHANLNGYTNDIRHAISDCRHAVDQKIKIDMLINT